MKVNNYDELLAYLNKQEKQVKLVVKFVGVESIIEKILEDEGPTKHCVEKHGFNHGPYEEYDVYREIDSDSEEINEYAADHYDDLFTVIEDFIDAVKKNKDWLEKFFNEDYDAINQYNNSEDPLTEYMSSKDNYNEDFTTYICEYLF